MKIRNSKYEMVRLAHHPEPSRRANSKFQFPNVQNLKVLFKTGVLSFGHLILRILVIVSGFEIRISNLR